MIQQWKSAIQRWYTQHFASDRKRLVVHVWRSVPPAQIYMFDCPRGSRFKAYADYANRTTRVQTERLGAAPQQTLDELIDKIRKEHAHEH